MLANYAKKARVGIVEIGSMTGKSAYILLKNSTVPFVSIDSYQFTDWDVFNYSEIEISNGNLEFGASAEKISNTIAKQRMLAILNMFSGRGRHLHMDSNIAWSEIPEKSFDFLFIDGDHSYQGVKNDWNNYVPRMTKHGVVILHDYADNIDNGAVKKFVAELIRDGHKFSFKGACAVCSV